ncbi:MAG: DnaB-like helicase C-terminal domain-containing protein, partial [Ilumatobacteraceae bacterium]
LVASANGILRALNCDEVKSIGFDKAYQDTIKKMRDIKEGKKRSILNTGLDKFDEVVALSEKKMICIAAQKKVGKTRFTVDLIDRIIGNNKDVAVQWFSLEMLSDELVRCFISRKVKLTDKQLMGKGHTLTDFEMNHIEAAYEYFKKYPIEFIDEPVNVFNICSRFERFAEKHKGKLPILVIDNLGLIKPHIENSNLYEDDIARMLKNLRDITGGIIIFLHHLTKESESKWNKETAYEPKTTHIRGSSRIADFSNQILLLHRPDHYSDLVEEAKAKGLDIKGIFQVDVAANRDGSEEKIIFRHQIQHCLFEEK